MRSGTLNLKTRSELSRRCGVHCPPRCGLAGVSLEGSKTILAVDDGEWTREMGIALLKWIGPSVCVAACWVQAWTHLDDRARVVPSSDLLAATRYCSETDEEVSHSFLAEAHVGRQVVGLEFDRFHAGKSAGAR